MTAKSVFDGFDPCVKKAARKARMVKHLVTMIELQRIVFGEYPSRCEFHIDPECCCGKHRYFTLTVTGPSSTDETVDRLMEMCDAQARLPRYKFGVVTRTQGET